MSMLGVIDIGSNSLHLTIFDNDLEVIDDHKYPLRLGNDVAKSKRISTENVQAMISYLEDSVEVCKPYTKNISIIATHSFRLATNQSAVVKEVLDKTGLKINVISGEEEAKLIYLGHQYYFDLRKKSFLIIDIGGGSTEMIYNYNDELCYKSVPLGSVIMNQRFIEDTDNFILAADRLYGHCLKQLETSLSDFPPHSFDIAIGGSGTIKDLAKADRVLNKNQEAKIHNYDLSLLSIKTIYQQLKTLGSPKKIASNLPFNRRRSEIILAGTTIFNCISDFFHIKEWTISKASLRDGVAFNEFVSISNQQNKDKIQNLMPKTKV